MNLTVLINGVSHAVEIDNSTYDMLQEQGGNSLADYCTSLFDVTGEASNLPESIGEQPPVEEMEGQFWDEKKIKLLITLRLERDVDFSRPVSKKCKLWQKIANEFNQKGYRATSKDLEKKFNNLKQTYIRNKERSKKAGEASSSWCYFDIFDRALGTKANVQPSAGVIGDVISDDNSRSSLASSSSGMRATPGKRKKTLTEELLEFKKQKFQWQKEKFEALEKLEHKKIQVIQDLTEALKNKK